MIRELAQSILTAAVGASPMAELSPLTTDEIVRNAEHRTSVPSLLNALPIEFREHFMLAFAPRGNQTGSSEFPRGFYFGRNAVVAYGACPGARNPDAVELMDFRGTRSQLIEIDFSTAPSRITVNPSACTACHGHDARPLWPSGTATSWEGFYGSGHAYLTSHWEEPRFADFKAAAPQHPRYATIPNLAPYRAFMSGTHGVYAHNRTFEDVVSALVVRRTVAYLREHPSFRRAVIPLLAALGLWRRQGREVVPISEYARVLAPHLGHDEHRVAKWFGDRLPRTEATAREHARREWRAMTLATGLGPDADAIEMEIDPRHLNVMTVLAHITEIYGLDRFDRSMSTSRTDNPFGMPGLTRTEGSLFRLEQALFDEVLAQTGLTAAELGRVQGWSLDRRRRENTQWAGMHEFGRGLARLSGALGRPPCADHFL